MKFILKSLINGNNVRCKKYRFLPFLPIWEVKDAGEDIDFTSHDKIKTWVKGKINKNIGWEIQIDDKNNPIVTAINVSLNKGKKFKF